VRVILRLPERKEVEVRGDRPLKEVLEELGLNPETVVAVRGKNSSPRTKGWGRGRP
jgi:sulfur carrier protein